jgi:hypothetical protein
MILTSAEYQVRFSSVLAADPAGASKLTLSGSRKGGWIRTSYASLRSEPTVVELNLKLTAGQALEQCRRRGLVVRSERELAGRTGSHHWHLRMPGRAGTLELNEWQNRVWVKVHPLRDGGWATALAYELSARRAE